jgi:SSS family solute:Na+ symporter
MTAPPDYTKLDGLTYGTITDDHRSESRKSWGFPDLFWSGVTLAGILSAYLYFRG